MSARTGVLVPGWNAHEVRVAAHSANLSAARATPGEQPFVVGWDLLETPAGLVVVLDVDEDAELRAAWLAHFPSTSSVQEAAGEPIAEGAEVRLLRLPLDPDSMAGQEARDGRLDRFHVRPDVAEVFADEVRTWVGDTADFYRLDTGGVRTYRPATPLEAPLQQTLVDVAIGYGGPVGYSVTAVDDDGWKRVTIGALGLVTYAWWSTGLRA